MKRKKKKISWENLAYIECEKQMWMKLSGLRQKKIWFYTKNIFSIVFVFFMIVLFFDINRMYFLYVVSINEGKVSIFKYDIINGINSKIRGLCLVILLTRKYTLILTSVAAKIWYILSVIYHMIVFNTKH